MIRAIIYLFKVHNRNTRKRRESCSKLTIKTLDRRCSDVFIINFEHISRLFLVYLLLTLNKQMLARIKILTGSSIHNCIIFSIFFTMLRPLKGTGGNTCYVLFVQHFSFYSEKNAKY